MFIVREHFVAIKRRTDSQTDGKTSKRHCKGSNAGDVKWMFTIVLHPIDFNNETELTGSYVLLLNSS